MLVPIRLAKMTWAGELAGVAVVVLDIVEFIGLGLHCNLQDGRRLYARRMSSAITNEKSVRRMCGLSATTDYNERYFNQDRLIKLHGSIVVSALMTSLLKNDMPGSNMEIHCSETHAHTSEEQL